MNFRLSVIIAELWRPEVAKPENFVSNVCVFWKMTLCGKIFKLLFRKFSPPHRSTLLCSNVVKKISDGKWVKSCVIDLTKNSAASQTVDTARIAPKICQGQPPTMCSQCSRFHPNRSTFGGVIAECVNTGFCPLEYFYDRLFKPITRCRPGT